MNWNTDCHRSSSALLLLAAMLSLSASTFAQSDSSSTVPDAQVEANVLKALAGAPTLANESVSTNTVYGTVTLSGTVRDESARTLAETLASRAPGVKKVIDELTIGTDAASQQSQDEGQNQPQAEPQSGSQGGTNPNLQSDGTMAPTAGPQPGQAQNQAPPPQQPASSSSSQTRSSPRPPYPAQSGPQDGANNQQWGPPPPPPYRRPYGPPPPPAQRTYVDQPGGRSVVIPTGALLRVRVNQPLSSQNSDPGAVFDGTVVSDVVADGAVAIPRGAGVQGRVVDSHSSGAIKGRGELSLQLTQVILGGQTFPVVSDVWVRNGSDKSLSTVNSAVGLGAVGAIIGGIAGGGAGAAIGAGVGGAAGIGASAASGGGQVYLPAEALLTFHLAQETAVTTVSSTEMQRLAYGAPAGGQLQRRYPPPPPPYYIGPVYYPRYPRYYRYY